MVPRLGTVVAGVAMLTVPAIAALGGVLFLGEQFTLRFTISSLCILCGLAVVVSASPQPPTASTPSAGAAGDKDEDLKGGDGNTIRSVTKVAPLEPGKLLSSKSVASYKD